MRERRGLGFEGETDREMRERERNKKIIKAYVTYVRTVANL